MNWLTLTVEFPPLFDRHGEPIPDSQPDDALVAGCMVAPRVSEEQSGFSQAVITGLTVYAPVGTTLTAQDRVLVPGYAGRWEIDGLPGRWDLHGPPGGVVLNLRQVA